MKFVLIVEGHTEQSAVPDFLRRWLHSRNSLPKRVGIDVINLKGGGQELFGNIIAKADYYLKGPGRDPKIIAVLGMLDLYNPSFCGFWRQNGLSNADERYKWAVDKISNHVNHHQFRMFFAVHEVEAWLLSQPDNLHVNISAKDRKRCERPEEINFMTPPSKWLSERYNREPNKKYKKIVHGNQLFSKLSPDTACDKCPHLKKMLDEMENLARKASGAASGIRTPLRD
jgi:hypothetical protein